MEKVTKSIFVALSILIIGAIVMTYYRTIVRKDYVVFPDETSEEESIPSDESFPFDPLSEPDLISSEEGEGVTP